MARPKGYADWRPKPGPMLVVQQVQQVLDEYADHLPLTVRQIFYRLVGAYGYDKTERAYARLAEYLVRARRAQMISFSAIRDDGTQAMGGGGYASAADWWDRTLWDAQQFRLDRMAPQPVRVELWCEAAGMVPQLARAVGQYSVPVYSTGGFSSVTVTHQIAQRAINGGKPTVFLHIGDYDPSGQSIFDAMADDAAAFVWGEHGDHDLFRPVRVALTRDQVDEYNLPTAPPKSSDTRSVNWFDETCQAEALPPDLLADIARQAVVDQLDEDLHAQVLSDEQDQGQDILARLDEVMPDAD